MIAVHRSDLEKIDDALSRATQFHCLRDQMNAETHMAQARLSPLTSSLVAARDRLARILHDAE